MNIDQIIRHVIQGTVQGEVYRAYIHAIDGGRVDIRIGSSPNAIRNVEVIGDADALRPGQEVSISWKRGRPIVLSGVGNSSGSSGDGTSGPHASTHQSGGSDQIDVTGLRGKLADGQDAVSIRGVPVSVTPPSEGQALVYQGGAYVPGTVASSSGGGGTGVNADYYNTMLVVLDGQRMLIAGDVAFGDAGGIRIEGDGRLVIV